MPPQHPEVLDAFLQAQLDATDFLNSKPLEAARIVADGSGLPQEVVYLYNGPGGTSFDTTLKPSLVEALKGDVPYLKSIGDFADLDVAGFVQDGPLGGVRDTEPGLRQGGGRDGEPVRARRRRPRVQHARQRPNTGQRTVARRASDTRNRRPPRRACCKAVRDATAEGAKVRAAYVPDAELGTRWFADKSSWVRPPTGWAELPAVRHAGRRPAIRRRSPWQRDRWTTSRR